MGAQNSGEASEGIYNMPGILDPRIQTFCRPVVRVVLDPVAPLVGDLPRANLTYVWGLGSGQLLQCFVIFYRQKNLNY